MSSTQGEVETFREVETRGYRYRLKFSGLLLTEVAVQSIARSRYRTLGTYWKPLWRLGAWPGRRGMMGERAQEIATVAGVVISEATGWKPMLLSPPQDTMVAE